MHSGEGREEQRFGIERHQNRRSLHTDPQKLAQCRAWRRLSKWGVEAVYEDLNYEELKRRANSRLPDRVVAVLEAHGERRSVAAGEILYRVDDRQYPFVYAVSATLQVRDPDGMVLGALEPGQFTGELGLLLGQPAFADCIAVESGEVVLVAPLEIADLVQVDPEVSDILLPAFAARRLLLMQRQQGTLTLVGHEGAPALQSVVEYAERNRIPYR